MKFDSVQIFKIWVSTIVGFVISTPFITENTISSINVNFKYIKLLSLRYKSNLEIERNLDSNTEKSTEIRIPPYDYYLRKTDLGDMMNANNDSLLVNDLTQNSKSISPNSPVINVKNVNRELPKDTTRIVLPAAPRGLGVQVYPSVMSCL